MIRSKKFISLLIAVTMLLSLFGCSSNSSSEQDSAVSQTEAQATEPVVLKEHKHEKSEKPVYDPDATCSIFIYMCGSNLESKSGLAGKDIDELLEADIPDQVNVVIETGGASKWHSHDIANDKLQRYVIKDHKLTLVKELDDQSMGDPDTYLDFLNWGKTAYPADRNLLIVWDHGGDATKGVCYDENHGFEGLKQSEFGEIPREGDTAEAKKFDMVIFDTCLMGNIETADWMQDYFHYMIASEVIVPGGGLDYKVIAGEFSKNDDEAFGKLVCDSFMEQSKAMGQENKVELSLFDLSCTDGLLNELEAVFAGNIAAFQKPVDTDALSTSEYSDARIYHIVAEGDTPMENGNSYNSIDIYNFTRTFALDLNLKDKVDAALEKLVIYHVGDVTTRPFPDLDPDYYVNRSNGISLYFPLTFDRSEMTTYLEICPIEQYAVFLDTLYMHLPDVPLEFKNKGSINKDGLFEVTLTDESGHYLKEVSIKLWKQRKKDKLYTMFGTQTIDSSDMENMTVTIPFNGEWYSLGGHLLDAMAKWKQNTNYLTSPIELNGETTAYNFSYSYNADKKPVFTTGTVGIAFDENGLVQRDSNFTTLKKGDVVKITHDDVYEESPEFTVDSDDITAEIMKLEPGMYRLQIIAVDINDQFISSDYAVYKITKDGVKALGVTKAE